MRTEALARSCVSQLSALRRLLGLYKLLSPKRRGHTEPGDERLAPVGFHKRRPHMHVHNPPDRDRASCAITKSPNELNCKVILFFF